MYLQTRMDRFGITFPVLFAPMVGLSHIAFRELIRSYLPPGIKPLMFTEMLSTRRLPSERLETVNEAKCADNETHLVPQLLGNEEKFIAPSIEKLMSRNPWGFDINMGCPVAHVLKHNWGVRLMGDKDYAAEVVRMAKRHSRVPVSVKLRGSGNEAQREQVDDLRAFTTALADAGADWLTVHARPRSQRHSGQANWSAVSAVRRNLDIPVVANGDVQTAEDILTLLRDFQVDGAMVGRAATVRPWIAWQVCARLGYGASPPGYEYRRPPETEGEEGQEYFVACGRLLDLLQKYFDDESFILKKMTFFVATGSRWFPFGHNFWKTTTKAKSVSHLRELIGDYARAYEHPMYKRIEL